MEEKADASTASASSRWTGSWQTFLPFAWSNGASITDEDGTEYTIDSPEMTEALEYYKSFFDEGLLPTALLDPGELESGFADGSYGAFISGPWHTGLVEDAGVSQDEYAVAPLPGKDSAPGTSFVGGGDLAVFSDSDNKDGAWKFVQWLSEPETQQAFYDEVGDLPAVQVPGSPASWPTTRSCRSSASSSRAPSPAGRPDLGAGGGGDRQRDREGHQGRHARRRGRRRHAEAGRVDRHRTLTWHPTRRPGRGPSRGPGTAPQRAATSTRRGASRRSPRGCSRCRSWCCSWCSPPGRCWPASA